MANINDRVGSYILLTALNSGRFGSVYTAKHIIFDDKPIVAVKLLHASFDSPKEQEQFIQEARLLNKLKHSHILPIIEAGIHEHSLYLVVEYASRGSLRDCLNRRPTQPLPIDEALTILKQVGKALQFAHAQNVIHRDLKPENILFNAANDVLLADFGIAVVLASGKTNEVGSGGTGAYMAPEQFAGIVSKKSDQYALGCIAYELFTGQKPFQASFLEAIWYQHAKVQPTPPTQLNPQLPVHMEKAILKALAKDRNERFADVASFINALETRKKAISYFKLKSAGMTDVGRVPISNQDNILIDQSRWGQESQQQQYALYMVADGMSEYANGQDASSLAILVSAGVLSSKLASNEVLGKEDFRLLLKSALERANAVVYERNQKLDTNMGTTMVVALVANNRLHYASVGDSRLYLFREGRLIPLTVDHSYVGQLLRSGKITVEEAKVHPERERIVRSVGQYLTVDIDVIIVTLTTGDRLLLCSDGLWRMVSDKNIARVLDAYTDPEKACKALIHFANDSGGKNNISVIVVQLE